MKTYRQIRQSLTEVGADREEDQNFKLGPEKMSPTPSDEDEYDELDDDIEDTHQEVEAIRPLYVRDKLGHYTTSDTWSSSGTMAQMTQQAATKNLQSEYVPEDGEVLEEEALEENAMDSLKKIVSRQTAETIRLADGSRLKVDMTTANALLGVHGALNIHNQKKMADTLNSNKAGFAKMSKFAFKQFGSRSGKVGTPNTGVQEGLDEWVPDSGPGLAAQRSHEADIASRQRTKKYRMNQAAKTADRAKEQAANRADPGGVQRGNAERLAKQKAAMAAAKAARLSAAKAGKPKPSPYTAHAGTSRARSAAPRKSRTQTSEYTPDHGETFAETENVVPGGSYTEAERKAAAKRAKAKRENRAAERKKKKTSNDDSDYDKGNYPGYWTDKDEEYQKIKSQIKELASRIEVR